ncbi:MAG: KpsF/GutQ family sugar-phosphate isomerase [Rhizorhabdus sp.]|nr:KpsF/GutQ family sugar-phosphate isomerase [Rhizorhabdus sp.]
MSVRPILSPPLDQTLAAARLEHGRSVLNIESAAIAAMAAELDDSFAEAVGLLLSLRGRIVVTGMGKSGHVARKIAATLASTGTPALFVHPAEAAHGDLGMVIKGDALIMLSNSGGTTELVPILYHASSLGLPIIAISSKVDSTLMKAATIGLLLPEAEEACPDNIVPTTSTTMMLALGDALAMATMRERGVSRDGFERLHPGGMIGLRLMRVATVMHKDKALPLVLGNTPMRDVVLTMTERSFGVAGVVDTEGHLVGVITDGDLRRHVDQLMTSQAAEVMTHNPLTIGAGAFAEDALTVMNKHKITSLFVTERLGDRTPIGLVHVHDFLRFGLT